MAATSPWQISVQPVVERATQAYGVPGAVIAVARDGQPVEYLVVGTDAAGLPLAEDSLAPVASVTKLATALTVLRLVDREELDLDDALAFHLPEAEAAKRDDVTVRRLFCHAAGLPVDPPRSAAPYGPGLDWPMLARACLATPADEQPGRRVRYSNVGPGLLAIIVERLTGKVFREAMADLVLAPLGIEGYLGVEPPRTPARVAGELGEHAGTDLDPYNSAFWRSLGLPWGGLVTTAAGAIILARAFAGAPPGFLSPALVAEATSNQTDDLGGGFFKPLYWPRCPWGLGAELRGDKTPHWTPPEASPGSFGHAGASGCLAWTDPAARLTWAILGTHTFMNWWPAWPEIGAAIYAACV